MAVSIGPKIGVDGESEYRKQINGLIQQAKTLASEMKVVTSAFDKNTSAQDKATATGKVLEKQIATQRDYIKQLAAQLGKSIAETGESSTATLKLEENLNKATAALNKMKSQLSEAQHELRDSGDATNDLNNEMGKAETGAFSFGDALKANILAQAVVDGVKRLASEIRDLAGDIIQTGMSFEASMSGVKAISGATEQEFESLRQKALELAQGTQFTATETADAMKYMAMAGWNWKQMMDGLEGVMNLATASGEDLATVSDIVTDALTAFGLGAEDSSHFADVLAVAASNANTNVGMMGDTFRYVAPLAGAMGYSVEDVAVAVGIMANSGIKASQAGTSLRSILTRLANPTNDSAAAMEALGISVTNSDGTMKSLREVISDLRTGFAGLSAQEAASYASMLGGQEAMSGLLALVNATEMDINNLTGAIANSNGAAQEMAATMTDNLSGDMAIMNSAFDGVKVEIYEHFAPALREAVTQMTGLAGKVQEFISSGGLDRLLVALQYLVPAVGALTAALVAFKATVAITTLVDALTKSLKAYQAANEGATIAQWALNAAQAASPVGVVVAVVVAAVAAIVAGILLLWNTSEDFRNTVKGWWENLMRKIQETKDAFVQFWAAIKEIWDNFIAAIEKAKDAVHDFFFKTIPEGFHAAVDFFKSLPDQAMQWGKDMIQGFMDGVLDKARGLIDAVKGVADKVRGFLHFSRPDEGPLRDYETWMPDMMKGLAKGITDNAWRLEKAASLAAGSISVAAPIVPTMQLAGAYGTASQQAGGITNLGGVTLHIYGAEGQDVNALADIVMDRIEAKVEQIGGAWV